MSSTAPRSTSGRSNRAAVQRKEGSERMTATRGPAAAYGTSVTRPHDFDAFWAAIMDEARDIPLRPAMTHIPLRSTPEVDVYEIHYDSLDGLRIAGWYCVPKESYLPPPYPALLL